MKEGEARDTNGSKKCSKIAEIEVSPKEQAEGQRIAVIAVIAPKSETQGRQQQHKQQRSRSLHAQPWQAFGFAVRDGGQREGVTIEKLRSDCARRF